MNLKLESNTRNCLDFQLQLPTGAVLMMTAPLVSDRWIFRVALRKNLALLAVPQFGGVDIYLQSGKCCEINVPYENDDAEIMHFIDSQVTHFASEATAKEAIKLLKAAVKKWRCQHLT
jgi:hypothetical protein